MTVSLLAVGIILLSMGKSGFQVFAHEAGPYGKWSILSAVGLDAKY